MGITLNVEWKEPKTVNDTEAARRSVEFMVGWFAHPIYVNGDYSDIMRKQVDMKSKAQGLTRSRLPVFTDAEKKSIQGEHDRKEFILLRTPVIGYPKMISLTHYMSSTDFHFWWPEKFHPLN